ncbi:hypothetical protein SERLA73DRAFT_80190 [Serpula lacrymans var. lacrymans S7.3]|uniref:Uncharacterized protein n=2 Tax=Serpula lacrymans var. lacrymans TaxID=341189 RepID=F8QJ04_SERL3|nr:uncharacterized protein SERLADRAFT_433364 [Serpula lacrymans var. lacrymans S7.9]EGN91716.1 hypothetical protein SERLA73DRAFT_80190 [Serpula lacrymans var. lacrymans S7.3]EGO29374.1 hypothetical protein SERLADRAFT_433364 [Serpula lacrymans var. lacrymans S7.9]
MAHHVNHYDPQIVKKEKISDARRARIDACIAHDSRLPTIHIYFGTLGESHLDVSEERIERTSLQEVHGLISMNDARRAQGLAKTDAQLGLMITIVIPFAATSPYGTDITDDSP